MKSTDVKSYLIACKVMKRDPKAMPIVSMLPKNEGEGIIAAHQLKVIADAINFLDNQYKANPKSTTQEQWYPIFNRHKGFAFSRSICGRWFSYTDVGSRHCFRFGNEENSNFFGTHFNKLHVKLITS